MNINEKSKSYNLSITKAINYMTFIELMLENSKQIIVFDKDIQL